MLCALLACGMNTASAAGGGAGGGGASGKGGGGAAGSGQRSSGARDWTVQPSRGSGDGEPKPQHMM